jgi:hypothetical protein
MQLADKILSPMQLLSPEQCNDDLRFTLITEVNCCMYCNTPYLHTLHYQVTHSLALYCALFLQDPNPNGWQVLCAGFPSARVVGLDACLHLPLLLVVSEDRCALLSLPLHFLG